MLSKRQVWLRVSWGFVQSCVPPTGFSCVFSIVYLVVRICLVSGLLHSALEGLFGSTYAYIWLACQRPPGLIDSWWRFFVVSNEDWFGGQCLMFATKKILSISRDQGHLEMCFSVWICLRHDRTKRDWVWVYTLYEFTWNMAPVALGNRPYLAEVLSTCSSRAYKWSHAFSTHVPHLSLTKDF